MKVCKMGLESVWINRADGEVRMCGWTDYNIGKLTDSSMEELWHGEKAEEFRRTMLDGSYRYCSNKCPYCANGTKGSLMVEYAVPEYPQYCSLSYEESCNYVCKFCRSEKYIPLKDEKDKIKNVEKEIEKFIGSIKVLCSNGVGELFCSPSIIRTLSNVQYREDLKIELESNGSLFNEKNWEKISNLGKHNLTVYITVHSFHEDTYRFLSGTTLSVSNVINNLRFIKSLREKEVINHFELATVVCERNFREMPEYVKFALEEFNPDKIRLRFFEPYGVRNRAIEWFYDIRNPYHPYYEEFVKVMENPVLDNPKVWKWQGETLSDLKEHPYFDEQKKVKLLSNLMIMENIGEKIAEYLKEHQIGKFTLYGNGYVGQAFVSLLEQNRIRFGNILDSYAEDGSCFKEHMVVSPCKENIKEYDMIIITSAAYEEIKKTLLEMKYEGKVISLNDLVRDLECCKQNT